jgi:hypothetical protein
MCLLPNCDRQYLIQYNEYAALRLEIRVSNPEILEQTALHCFHTRSEAHPASYVLVWVSFPRVKQLNVEADHSIAFGGEDEIYGSCIST